MTEKNKALVTRYIDAINAKTLDRAGFDDYFAPGYFEITSVEIPDGAEGQYLLVEGYKQGFPDFHITVDDQIAEGDKVLTAWTFKGTHTGDFNGIPATNKEVNVRGMSLWQIKDGRNVREWEVVDLMALMTQLGVLQS